MFYQASCARHTCILQLIGCYLLVHEFKNEDITNRSFCYATLLSSDFHSKRPLFWYLPNLSLLLIGFYHTMHYSAKRGIVIACCPSVRLSSPSARPSLCNVDGSGRQWHRLEILKTNCTNTYPNTFTLRSPNAIQLLPGEDGDILGRLEVRWEKVACWSTKAAISLKHVKIEEKLLRRAYRKSSTLFPTVPFPYTLLFLYFRFATSAQNSNRDYLRNG